MEKLKKYLLINAYFSGLSGITMVFLNGYLQSLFGFENNLVFPIIGVNLLFFFGFVLFTAKKQLGNKLLVNIITVLDVLWVVGSFVLIEFDPFDLSTAGLTLTFVVALWIGFLAFMQFRTNK